MESNTQNIVSNTEYKEYLQYKAAQQASATIALSLVIRPFAFLIQLLLDLGS